MEDYYKDYHRRFEKLSKVAADRYPGLSLYKGCEILCYREEMPEIISNIKNDIFPTMNGTDYMLLEFDPHGTEGVEEMIYCLNYALDAGYTPIIAHVERYKTIYDDPLTDLIRLKEMGCLVQINLYSVEQDPLFAGAGASEDAERHQGEELSAGRRRDSSPGKQGCSYDVYRADRSGLYYKVG